MLFRAFARARQINREKQFQSRDETDWSFPVSAHRHLFLRSAGFPNRFRPTQGCVWSLPAKSLMGRTSTHPTRAGGIFEAI